MPIIAISRGTFSGGEALATQVAEQLGYPCLSREMNLAAAATQYQIAPEELTAAIEKRPSLWDRLAGGRVSYLSFVRAALCEQAQEEKLVYHGFLGHLLLSGIAHVIGVRVIADLEYRLAAAMREQQLAYADARTYIERVDKERREWTRALFAVEWDDPLLYDLVLNLSRMRLETAAAQVASLAERAEFQPTAASGKALRDLTLSSQVLATLGADARTRDAALKVTADDGHVTITHATPTREVTEVVPALVRQIAGVKSLTLGIREATPPPPRDWGEQRRPGVKSTRDSRWSSWPS